MTNLPDNFSDDPVTERLACYFEELYAYLIEEGVPEDCLPSPWHVLRRVTQAIDHERLRGWLDAYVAVEAQAQDDDEGDGERADPRHPGSARPEVRRRPSYLRALEADGVRPPPKTAQEDASASVKGDASASVKGDGSSEGAKVPQSRQAPDDAHTAPDE